jgi:hypothetical protein
MKTPFKKADDELQIVWGEVYAPMVPDSQNDFMRAEEILKAAYSWMAKSNTRCIDMEHDGSVVNAVVVESFVAREGDPVFLPGAWVIGVHVPEPGLWAMVKKGDFNGFSMAGAAVRHDSVEMEIPAEVSGVTKADAGHTHDFSVAYAPNGEFIGGVTDEVDGHYHVIKNGTVTEEAGGHHHVFDYVRGVMASAEEEG